jgi:hypothetical protein
MLKDAYVPKMPVLECDELLNHARTPVESKQTHDLDHTFDLE